MTSPSAGRATPEHFGDLRCVREHAPDLGALAAALARAGADASELRLYAAAPATAARRRAHAETHRSPSAEERDRAGAATQANAANERWPIDFIHDRLASDEAVRILSVVDVFTRECVALVPQMRFRGDDVARCLSVAGATRGLRAVIQADNGSEFT